MISPFHTSASLNLSVETNVTLKNGILRINCDPSVFNWIPKSFRNVALSSFVQDLGRPLRRMKCSAWVNHTVFWIYRWDYKNAYHFMEDVVTTFESLVVLNQDPNDVELVIYDGQPNNSALFTLWPKLMGKGVRMVRENPFPRNTCFRRSISNMFASRSHLTNHLMYARDTNSTSPILLGLRQWILDRLGIGTERRIPLKIKIVFISRKPMKGREITRIIQNEPEIHEAIRTTYPDAIFQIFQPEEFPTFKEQVQEILDADILIGAHGAGLMYSLFMRPGSTLIEIFMDDRTSGNRHFHNVATWTGLNYDSIGHFTSNVEVEPLMEALNRTLNAQGIHY